MAWTAPRTWTIGEFVTKAIMDTHVRDNFLAVNPIPKARVIAAALGLAGADTYNTVQWTSETYDTDTIHDNSTNPSRLTCKTAGTYRIWAECWKDNADQLFTCRIRLNGSTEISSGTAYDHGNPSSVPLYTEYVLAVNDYVEVQAKSSAGSGNLTTASRFGMSRISD